MSHFAYIFRITSNALSLCIKIEFSRSILYCSTLNIFFLNDNLVKVARDIMKQEGGDPKLIPKWKSSDFDSIY